MNIWKHGKYLDLWSLVHLLSSFLLGGFFYWLGTSFLYALLFSSIIILLWEGVEFALKIIEPSVNVIVDIIIGLIGFFGSAYIHFYKSIPFDLSPYLLLAFATSMLGLWGFLDFKKKGYH